MKYALHVRAFLIVAAILLLGIVSAACAPAAQPTTAPAAQPPATTAPAAQPTTAPVAQPTTAPAAQPTAAAAGGGKTGGTLRIGLDVDAGTADPRLMKDTSAYRLRELVFDGLVNIKPDFTPAPNLAETWDNPDEKTWVFHLKKGVKFHNGTELTATDVKFTYDTILDEKFASPLRSFFTPVKSIEAVDNYTVKFTLDSAYGPFLSYLNQGIVSKAAVEKAGDQFASNPVGTGPFKFVSWKRADTISLEANPDYFGGRPKVDKIELKIVPDNSARVVALEAGDLDLVQSPLSPQDVTRLQGKAGFQVNRTPAAGYTYVGLNCADPFLSDVKVRQALSYMVNRDQILNSIYKGIGSAGKGPIPPGMWAYSSDIPTYTYDPKKAQALLDEAGWKAGADGKRTKDGKPLKLTIRTHSEDPDRRQLIEVLQAELTNIGIQADTNVIDFPTFFADVQAGKYQMGVIGWLNLANPDQATFRQFTIGGSGNYGKCEDAQVDKLIKDARVTLDQAKAKDLYQQATKLIVDKAFYLFVQNQEYVEIQNTKVKGFVLDPVQNFLSIPSVTVQ